MNLSVVRRWLSVAFRMANLIGYKENNRSYNNNEVRRLVNMVPRRKQIL